jgi:hypothetical protein
MSRRILLHWDDASNTRAGSWRSMLLPWTTKPPIMGGNADTWTIVAKKNTMALAGRSHCAFGLTRTLLTYNIWFNFEDQATFFIPGSTRPVPPTSTSGRSPAAASPAEKAAGCTSRPVCPTPGTALSNTASAGNWKIAESGRVANKDSNGLWVIQWPNAGGFANVASGSYAQEWDLT